MVIPVKYFIGLNLSLPNLDEESMTLNIIISPAAMLILCCKPASLRPNPNDPNKSTDI